MGKTFKERLLEDWGKEDVFGPWTPKYQEGDPLKFYKSYYLISDGESPQIENFKSEDLSDIETLNYFKDRLRRISKIPFSRFDEQNK